MYCDLFIIMRNLSAMSYSVRTVFVKQIIIQMKQCSKCLFNIN